MEIVDLTTQPLDDVSAPPFDHSTQPFDVSASSSTSHVRHEYPFLMNFIHPVYHAFTASLASYQSRARRRSYREDTRTIPLHLRGPTSPGTIPLHLQGSIDIESDEECETLERSSAEICADITEQVRAQARERRLCALRGVEYKAVPEVPLTEDEINLALPVLLNRFIMIRLNTVSDILRTTRSYSQTYNVLAEIERSQRPGELLSKNRKRRREGDLSNVSINLLRQLHAPDFATQVQEQMNLFSEERKTLIAEGKNVQCGCCFDDELTETDTLKCCNEHVFCFACIRRTAETFFAEGLYASSPGRGNWAMCVVRCMHMDGCNGTFSEAVLQQALPSESYVRYSQRALALSAELAKVEDLVSCPWCDFVVSMPNLSDSVVVCRNPSCEKKSCRWCQQKSHIPYHCDEVEKDWEVDMRTRIEEAINDEISQTCPKCSTIVEKIYGCNHMTCVCKTHFCYICGQVISKRSMNLDGEYHFGAPPKCDQFADVTKAERKKKIVNARKAGIAARDKFFEKHPLHRGKELKNCPIKALK